MTSKTTVQNAKEGTQRSRDGPDGRAALGLLLDEAQREVADEGEERAHHPLHQRVIDLEAQQRRMPRRAAKQSSSSSEQGD